MINKLLSNNYGIEKESLRVLEDGLISSTPHPFNNKFLNKYITVDFGEQQSEVITGVHSSIKEAMDEIQLLSNILIRKMPANEYLWPYSMPFGTYQVDKMALGEGPAIEYRQSLLKHSSVDKQLISGIHFNWSMNKELSLKMSDEEINAFYFKIFNLYNKTSFVVKHLFGMSPTSDFVSFDNESLRQGEDGYNNHVFVAQDSYEKYVEYINHSIKDGSLASWREQYTNARLKPFEAKVVEWLEIRNIDLNYLDEYGLNETAFNFIDKYLVFLSMEDLDSNLFTDTPDNTQAIIDLFKTWLKKNNLSIKGMNEIKRFELERPSIKKIIDTQKALSERVRKIPLLPLDNMELSTQILIEEAYANGVDVQILDKEKNVVSIGGVKLEMATLNPFDSKKGLEIMDSKIKSNIFLKENNIPSTTHETFKDITKAKECFMTVKDKKVVVKPVNTNFSMGLTVFENSFTKEEFDTAVDFAFSVDKEILVELFVEGQEYRFLVINQELVGVLKRVPANVLGDNKHTIEELVEIKNQNILRGVNYKLPLEKIKLGKIEKSFLQSNGYSIGDIPRDNETVFLRKNSNVSTGGDTYDVTAIAHEGFKKLAVDITQMLDLEVCGLDIIIEDIKEFKNYTILELNWNPAIHIHTYPLVGKNRHPAKVILKMIKKHS